MMKKKIIPGFLAAALTVSGLFVVPAVSVEAAEDSHPVRLVDYAELLDDTEYTELESKLDRISEEYDCDVAVITEDSIDGEDEVAYADDFFDYNDYGMGEDKSGVLFLITMSERKWCISTHGAAIDIFTDRGQEYISGEIKPSLSVGDYYEAFDTFADLCEQFIIQAESGEPYDVDNMPEKSMSPAVWIPVSLGIGLVISLIITGVMRGQMKSVRRKPDAADYMQKDSLHITRKNDLFLYHQISRSAKPKNEDSGGGSSTHTSSSGETHGGSSGSF